jgi:hypothetical protein
MTLEEMDFMLKHPTIPLFAVRAYLAQLKHHQEVVESARRAEESGMVARFVPIRRTSP